MSETPKTDKEEFDSFELACAEYPRCVNANFARKQEKEITALAKQCVAFVEDIAELRLALSFAEGERDGARAVIKSWKEDEGQDARRLDFLVNGNTYGLGRDDIDALMKEEQQ